MSGIVSLRTSLTPLVSNSDVQSVGSTLGGRLCSCPSAAPLGLSSSLLAGLLASLACGPGVCSQKVVRGILIMSLLCPNPSAHSRYKPGSLWWPVRPYIAWLSVTLASLLLSLCSKNTDFYVQSGLIGQSASGPLHYLCPLAGTRSSSPLPCLPSPFYMHLFKRSPIGEAVLSKIVKPPPQPGLELVPPTFRLCHSSTYHHLMCIFTYLLRPQHSGQCLVCSRHSVTVDGNARIRAVCSDSKSGHSQGANCLTL